jgi:hypothetical protein
MTNDEYLYEINLSGSRGNEKEKPNLSSRLT